MAQGSSSPLAGWIVAIFIFVILLLIAIGVGWWLRNHGTPDPVPPNIYNAPLGWGKPVAGPDPDKNTCQLYTFPSGLVDIGDPPVPTAVPGTPTYSASVLSGLAGVTGYPSCIDTDQIIAQQVQHTCTAPAGVVEGQITLCDLQTGGTTGLGGTEIFYTNSNCSVIPSCAGEISLLSLNYGAPEAPIMCLQNNGEGELMTMALCDPAQDNQLFRITRVNPGQNPASLIPGQEQNGAFAQILDRSTGLCLQPATQTTEWQYDPATSGNTGCTGNVDPGPQLALGLTMGSCTGPTGVTGPTGLGSGFPGYDWALIDSVQYCDNPDGCTGCGVCGGGCEGCLFPSGVNGCVGCNPVGRSTACSACENNGDSCSVPDRTCPACTGCDGHRALVTPPQIVYIGDLNLSTFPTGAYNGITGPSAEIAWLLDNNASALYYGGIGNPVLQPQIGLDVQTNCPDNGYTAQYINLTTFNIISAQSVCFADDDPLIDCINL